MLLGVLIAFSVTAWLESFNLIAAAAMVVALALQVADRLGLVVTGSSDYHGDGKVNRLGENTTDPRVLEQLEERARLPVIRP